MYGIFTNIYQHLPIRLPKCKNIYHTGIVWVIKSLFMPQISTTKSNLGKPQPPRRRTSGGAGARSCRFSVNFSSSYGWDLVGTVFFLNEMVNWLVNVYLFVNGGDHFWISCSSIHGACDSGVSFGWHQNVQKHDMKQQRLFSRDHRKNPRGKQRSWDVDQTFSSWVWSVCLYVSWVDNWTWIFSIF